MLNRVGGELYGADIVTIDKAGGLQIMAELLQKLPKPVSFSDAVCNSAVLSFRAGAGDGVLALRRPRDKAATEEDIIA
jgi:hypothetical protein